MPKPPPPPPAPTALTALTAPTALSASSTPTPSAWFGLCHCRPWLGFPSLLQVFRGFQSVPKPLPPHRPHRPHRFVHPHRPSHSTSFGSLPLSRPGCPWFGFSRLLEVFKGFQCLPKPPPTPSPPPPSPPPQPAAWFGFSSFLKVFQGFQCVPKPPPPPPPSPSPQPSALRPQRFAHPLYVVATLPHCPHRSSAIVLTGPPLQVF